VEFPAIAAATRCGTACIADPLPSRGSRYSLNAAQCSSAAIIAVGGFAFAHAGRLPCLTSTRPRGPLRIRCPWH
jgi:hypothetical protein